MSLRVPVCDYCKHYIDDSEVKGMCCEAFPDGIPLERMRLEDDGSECANRIKFEDKDGVDSEFVPEPGSLLARMHRI
ncbi:MAG: hypothetical protein HFH92_04085 [Lachnospiraceae bacterium]|uniref:hypothetical protein n=1 Tax=uncultured Acetatifactor sp. TaxID=1671927 RepID=UPI00261B67A8|nr:hypothetical protein [uncultured Acetatifactor sp.]MCI8788285.1 hypothetical protein [Lachnospiraceae bacterium]